MDSPVVVASLAKNARGERVRIALETFQGHNLIDIRITVALTETTNVQTTTRKGVACKVEMLPDLIAALQEAQAKAIDLGWIGEAA